MKDEVEAYRFFLAFALANAEHEHGRVLELAKILPQDSVSLFLMLRASMIVVATFAEVISQISPLAGGVEKSAAQLLREMVLDAAKPDFNI